VTAELAGLARVHTPDALAALVVVMNDPAAPAAARVSAASAVQPGRTQHRHWWVPIEILYDRMKTAVTGQDADGHIIYNRSLIGLGQYYGFLPRACRPYRAKTKGKVERPFGYIRQDFFLARTFCSLDDLNAQLDDPPQEEQV
jgi:hypothetical protein